MENCGISDMCLYTVNIDEISKEDDREQASFLSGRWVSNCSISRVAISLPSPHFPLLNNVLSIQDCIFFLQGQSAQSPLKAFNLSQRKSHASDLRSTSRRQLTSVSCHEPVSKSTSSTCMIKRTSIPPYPTPWPTSLLPKQQS